MKTCPDCGQQWAPKFKFCPEDGTPLPADAPAPSTQFPATSPSKRPKTGPATTDRRLFNLEPVPSDDPSPPSRTAPKVAKGKSASFERPEPEKPPEKPQRLVKDAASRSAPRAKSAARGEAPRDEPTSQHESIARMAPTQLLEAVPPEMVHETRRGARPDAEVPVRPPKAPAKAAPAAPVAPARKPEPEPEPAPAPAAKATKKPAKKHRDFSETAWFMRQPNPEEADPTTGKVKVDKKAYAVDEPLPEEGRKKFSLRRPAEED